MWPMMTRLDVSDDLFSEVNRLQRAMNRLFFDYGRSQEYPAVNVWASEESALVKAEVPGVDPKSLNISVTGNVLRIEGERKAEPLGEHDVYHRQERGYGSFSRSVTLPFDVDAGAVKASCSKGILSVTLPRSEASKPRKIAIQGE